MTINVDVMVIGSDICSIVAANLLSKKGYKVALIDYARRLGGNLCYLPVSSKWLHILNIESKKSTIIKGTTEKLTLYLLFGKKQVHSFLPFKISVMDVGSFCDVLAKDMETLFFLWTRSIISKIIKDEVQATIKNRSGEWTLKSRLLLQSTPISGKFKFNVSTGHTEQTDFYDSLIIDQSGINLYLRHGKLVTGVVTSIKDPIDSHISFIEFSWGQKIDMNKGSAMRFGGYAGHAAPPWVGDYLMSSAYIAYRLASTYLEGIEDESVLRQYLNFLSMLEVCITLYEYAIKGKLEELPAFFVDEALKPPLENLF